jgi:hypothetical protein
MPLTMKANNVAIKIPFRSFRPIRAESLFKY